MDDNRQVIHDGKFLRYCKRGSWEYVERANVSGIVVIVPVTDAGELVLVEQWRPPVLAHTVELPAGLAGDTAEFAGESMLTAARRELLEETGYAAETLQLVGHGAPSAGLSDEVVTLVYAAGLRQVGEGGGDEHEDITVHRVPLPDVPAWMQAQAAAGKAVDLKIYAGLWVAAQAAAHS